MSPIRILDPLQQQRHALHGETRIWVETSCYVDLWIELLNGLGLNPVVALGFALEIEFEDDQWTFLKYPLDDLHRAYGLDVCELALWRSTEQHVVDQLSAGRSIIIEVDSFYLADTAGTAYQKDHVKSSIAVTGIDPSTKTLEYFHGQGHFVLPTQDYDPLLRIGQPERFTGDVLPPYVEIVKSDRMVHLPVGQAAEVALELAVSHLTRRRSAVESAARFRAQLATQAPQLLADLPSFHAYAFATVRQLGAASELAADLMNLVGEEELNGLFRTAAQACKGLQFKFARLAAGRTVDVGQAVDDAVGPWLVAMSSAEARLLKPGFFQ